MTAVSRVITVTPNPSIDLLFDADELVWDDANRTAMPRRRAGGQGINVTRAVRALGGHSTAVALLGGRVGDEIAALLRAEEVPLRVAEARAETRVFVAVRERRTGRSLLLNPRGWTAGQEEQAALLTELRGALRAELQEAAAAQESAPWVVSSGSVPPGFGEDFHARVCDVALGMGARVVVDSDGPVLRAAAARCTLLVPNRHEAERLLGAAIRSMRDAGDAALALLRDGAAYAAITLGEEGAVLATRGESDVLFAQAPPAPAHASAVGAGDAFLAGLLLKLGVVDDGSALRHAVACGTAVLHADGAALLRVQDVERLEPLTDMKKAG